MANKHGLDRNIPAEVKRQVRQRCGFGCVICGLGIVQYEHFSPAFAEAKAHDANGITLLCPGCHAKKTSGMLSTEAVIEANANPACRREGFTRDFFDFGAVAPELHFGGMLIRNCPVPIAVRDKELFSIRPPDDPGGVFRFSGVFTDSSGRETLTIDDNEWKVDSDVWDLVVEGTRITIREAHRKIHLVLRANPRISLIVERLEMAIGGIKFRADADTLEVFVPRTGWNNLTGCIADNCGVGLRF